MLKSLWQGELPPEKVEEYLEAHFGREGSKGPRFYEWIRLPLNSPLQEGFERWLMLYRQSMQHTSSVIYERFQRRRRMGVFETLMSQMAEYYARELGGIGWRWQAMDSKRAPAPLGGESTGGNTY